MFDLFGRLKQLFCSHNYIVYVKPEPVYLSVGDEAQGRKSYEYYMTCSNCGNEMTLYKNWHTIDIEQSMGDHNP